MTDLRKQIREKIRRNLLSNYEVANKMGVSISNFYYRLQSPLTEESAEPFFQAIDDLIKEREKGQETEAQESSNA